MLSMGLHANVGKMLQSAFRSGAKPALGDCLIALRPGGFLDVLVTNELAAIRLLDLERRSRRVPRNRS